MDKDLENSRYGGYNTQNIVLWMKLFKNGKFYRKQYFMDTITNFRYGGITLKTIFFGRNTKKWQIPDIGITLKTISYG